MLKELMITIAKNSDEDFEYNIYDTVNENQEDMSIVEPLDGGICTGSMKSAINMACEMAHECNKSRIPYSVEKENKHQKNKQELSSPALCPECGSKATWQNSCGELQCDNCNHE